MFYRKFGVRVPQHLLTPNVPLIEKFSFPKESIYNFANLTGTTLGPPTDDYYIRDISKMIYMGHADILTSMKGAPRRLPTPPLQYIRKYHSQHRRFRWQKEVETSIKDPNTLVIYNYSLLPILYKYNRNVYSEYYKWWNIQSTIWNKIDSIAKVSNRQQYYFFNLPTVLPSVASLNMFIKTLNQNMLRYFDNHDSLFILELWKYFNPDTKDTSVLSSLSPESLNKINLVFTDSGRFVMFNLGLVNSWIDYKAIDNEVLDDKPKKYKFRPNQIQKMLLFLLMKLMQYRAGNVVEDNITTEDTKEKEKASDEFQRDISENKEDDNDDDNGRETTEIVEPQEDTIVDTSQIDKMLLELDNEEEIPSINNVKTLLDNLDNNLADLEKIEAISVFKKEEDNKGDALLNKDTTSSKKITVDNDNVNSEDFSEVTTVENIIQDLCNNLAEDGMLTASEYRKNLNLLEKYKSIKAIDGTPLEDFIKYNPEDIKINKEDTKLDDVNTVVDKSMLASTLIEFDKKYIKHVLPKDTAKMVVALQKAGALVTDYTVEKIEEIQGDFEIHTVKVKPIVGVPTTLRFKLPVVNENGVFVSNGIKYTMRKQKIDLPLRKVAPGNVAMTSYYSKTFITRSTKKVDDYGEWLRNKIMSKGLNSEDTDITDLHPLNCFDPSFKVPRVYSIIAHGFRSFKSKDYEFIFDYKLAKQKYGEDLFNKVYKTGSVIIGNTKEPNQYLIVDKFDIVYTLSGDNIEPLGRLDSLLNIEVLGAPIDFAQVKVFGKNISVGLILAYKLGLSKLLELLNVKPRVVLAGSRLNLDIDDWMISFADETYIFSRQEKLASMILAGLNVYDKALRKYSVYTFDKKDVYLNLLESVGLSAKFIKEIDLMDKMFVDPITDEILMEMKLPRTFRGLLVKACQMVLTDDHKDPLDPLEMRIRGYERLSGAVYAELVNAIREKNNKLNANIIGINLNPYAVWKRIREDTSLAICDEINPIQDLKEQEAITFSGTGGRSSRSMVKNTRKYHENDIGVVSESTSASGDAGINNYLTANPNFTTLRGTIAKADIENPDISSIVSTSALLFPASDKEDAKRTNFTSVQNSHTIGCPEYKPSMVRTGYEQIIAKRASDLYATIALEDGEVVSRNETGIVIRYKSGETKGIQLGKIFGLAAGLTLPHVVVCNLKTGDKFKKNDVIAYNTGFFEKDLLNPNNIVWKSGIVVKTAVVESVDTLEDASCISMEVANKLTTQTTKVKTIVVSFEQSIKNLVKVNSNVTPESILCIIEDAITSNMNLFDEDSLNTLKVLSSNAPSAKVFGVVDRIEVFYYGDKEDMSDSLRQLVDITDKDLAKRYKSFGRPAFTGRVSSDYRVEGSPLTMDTAAIKIYITTNVRASTGDKGVFANQLKTIFSEILPEPMVTESGEKVHARFGRKSIAARVVASPDIIGTTNTLLDVIGKRMVKIYKGK